jgi:hypothetical protein
VGAYKVKNLANRRFVGYTYCMNWYSRVLVTCSAFIIGCFVSMSISSLALSSDFKKPADTYKITLEYYNSLPSDQTLFVAGAIESSLNGIASGTVFEVTQIKNTYPLNYTPARGLSEISGTSGTQTLDVKPADASFINSQNKLSWVLTPNNDNRCGKLADVKGCVWDIGKKNQWDPEQLSCFAGTPYSCVGDKLNLSETNKLGAGLGGKYELTLKIKGGIDKDQLYYFPAQSFMFTPGSTIAKSSNQLSNISIYLSEKVTQAPPVVVTPSTTPVPTSAPTATPTPVVVSPLSTPLTRADILNLDLFCKDGVVNTTTNCTFTLPANKTIPSSFRVSIDTASSVSCIAKNQDVECPLVPLPATAGKKTIFVTLDSVRIDTLKKMNVAASTSDLVRSGAGDTSTIVFLISFIVLTATVVWFANKSKRAPIIRF